MPVQVGVIAAERDFPAIYLDITTQALIFLNREIGIATVFASAVFKRERRVELLSLFFYPLKLSHFSLDY
jgi:hypothetical protein